MPFSFFKKLFASGPKGPDYDQIVWNSHTDKFKALIERTQKQTAQGNRVLILAWYPKTLQEITFLLTNMGIPFADGISQAAHQSVVVELADKYLGHLPQTNSFAAGANVWLAEHYPLHAAEMALFEKLSTEALGTKPVIFASMDEQLFKAFGGDRIKEMMEKLGITKGEYIQHNLVKQSVIKAQQKIAEQVISEQKAASDEAWFAANYKTSI